MSIGVKYIAVGESELNTCIEKESSIAQLIEDKESYSVEQYWDGIRFLFLDSIPNLLGEDFIEFSDVGDQTLLIRFEDLEQINKYLENIQENDLLDLINSDEFKHEDFYWKETILKNPKNIIMTVLNLKKFLFEISKKEQQHAVLVCFN